MFWVGVLQMFGGCILQLIQLLSASVWSISRHACACWSWRTVQGICAWAKAFSHPCAGGQKVKVVLAAAMWNCPHLLVLVRLHSPCTSTSKYMPDGMTRCRRPCSCN